MIDGTQRNGSSGVKEFVTGQLMPFVGVVLAIATLTLALFDVPAREPPQIFGLRVPASADPVARTESERERVDDTLTRVLRTLDDGRRQHAAIGAEPSRVVRDVQVTSPAATAAPRATTPHQATQVAPPSNTPEPDPNLLSSVSALSDAVRAIHDARSEDDLIHAEDLVRNARVRMESSCATATGPLCASAQQIRALGY